MKRTVIIDLTYGYSNNEEYLESLKAIMTAFNISAEEAEGIFFDDSKKTGEALVSQGWEIHQYYDENYPRSCGCCHGEYVVEYIKDVDVFSEIKDVPNKEGLRDIFNLKVEKYHKDEYYYTTYRPTYGNVYDFKKYLIENKVLKG